MRKSSPVHLITQIMKEPQIRIERERDAYLIFIVILSVDHHGLEPVAPHDLAREV